MARAVKSEIVAMKSGKIISALRRDADDSRRLCRAIERFVYNSGTKLEGEAYDTARQIASQYIPILQNRAKAAEEMADAIKSGCSSFSSYMIPFQILDEALRDEYEQKLNKAAASLTALQEMRDEEGKWFFDWASYFTYKAIIEKCKLYLRKLDGLSDADLSAFTPIENAASSFNV